MAQILVSDVRASINIPEEKELANEVIESAIRRAESYFIVLRYRYAAPDELFDPSLEAYTNYLAYQAYADRVLNVPPGNYEEGKWTPIAEEIVRNTGDKLEGLRRAAFDLIDIIKSYPIRPTGTFHHHTAPDHVFGIGQFNYSQTYY